jgi:hypothetical protein
MRRALKSKKLERLQQKKAIICQAASVSYRLQSTVKPAVPFQPPNSPLPHLDQIMMKAPNFFTALAMARKSKKKIKPFVDVEYGDETLSISRIIKVVKEEKQHLISTAPT